MKAVFGSVPDGSAPKKRSGAHKNRNRTVRCAYENQQQEHQERSDMKTGLPKRVRKEKRPWNFSNW